jgi:hypothetical protein
MPLTLLPGTRPDLVRALAAVQDQRYITAQAMNRLESELRSDEEVVALIAGSNPGTVKYFFPLLVATSLRVLEITPKRLSQTCDLASTPIGKVTSIAKNRQGLSVSLFTPGNVTIRITLQGRNLDVHNVSGIDADAFIRAVQHLQMQVATPVMSRPLPPPPPSAPPPPLSAVGQSSRVAELSVLAALLDRGLVTPAEFEAEKARILR